MRTAVAVFDTIPTSPAWTPALPGLSRKRPGLLAALALHGLVLWIVLSGAGPHLRPTTPPPIIAHILPPPIGRPAPQPPAPRPRMSPAPSVETKSLVPEPELSMPTTSHTPEIESSSTAADVSAPTQGSTATPAAAAEPAPSGFGAISNREACLAAFRASYPREARRNRQEGAVTIAARIGRNGQVLSAEVVTSHPRRVFDRAALHVLNTGACTFDARAADYDWQGEISYRLEGESAD